MYSSSLNWIPNSIFCIFLLFCFFFVYLHYFILFHIFNSADFSLSVAFVCSAVCSAMRIHIYVAWELVFRLWRSDFTDDKNNHQWNIKLLCGYATKFTKYLIYILFVVNFFFHLSLSLSGIATVVVIVGAAFCYCSAYLLPDGGVLMLHVKLAILAFPSHIVYENKIRMFEQRLCASIL